ncbi:hypothetical protein C672_3598 [[Clostridium] bifermentans ATCC 638]|uniref:Uncharacterized protein n=1 Tax=Paraclostridium bifermentans ATCC 638 = DSM 14991 TaxID=1233171 RepID=T4VE33_PARBF|nr:hypothetical protein C672_3598 [[Clostridium] bifermentans ATCC 638] [Paraclostridium bifermentans ATCC 638 = DSM 14991]
MIGIKNIIKPTIEIKTKIDKSGNIINFYFEDNGKVIEDLNDLYI